MTTFHGILSLLAIAPACQDNRTFIDRDGRYMNTDAQPTCIPNLDGEVTRSELVPSFGTSLSFLVSPRGQPRTVDSTGIVDSGKRIWDWSIDFAEDHTAVLSPEPAADLWFADQFPQGQFVLPQDAGGQLLAVYSLTDTALLLHGTASQHPSPPNGQTLLTYDSPIALYRLPLRSGQTWSSTANVTGTAGGLPYAAHDTYDISDAELGELRLPSLRLTQVHRLNMKIGVTPAVGVPSSFLQVLFVFECFGEVARAISQPNETNVDFTTAVEVRRLGL